MKNAEKMNVFHHELYFSNEKICIIGKPGESSCSI
jgi:hypothetical protein